MGMKNKKLIRRAQSTLEYAALIAIVVGALIAMQAYVKRGLQGKLKSSADQIGEQYSPSTVSGVIVTNVVSNSLENVKDGTTSSNTWQNQEVQRNVDIGTLDDEEWFKE